MNNRLYETGTVVFFLALATRLVGVIITTLTSVNTYAQADADHFVSAAKYIADGFRRGVYTLPPDQSTAFHRWGTPLAPFWLLPGPSRLYARVGVALLGAYAVYNVFTITREYATREAGIIAVTPLVVYPSFIFIHSAVLREAAILFGITTAARLLIVPPRDLHPAITYVAAGGFLTFANVFRPDNGPVFVAVLALAGLLKYFPPATRPLVYYLSVPATAIVSIVTRKRIQSVLKELANIRDYRARGRTVYLGHLAPDTIPSAILFGWIGAGYFLFAPFPWMISTLPDMIAFFEGFINLIFAVAGVYGFRVLMHRNVSVAVALAGGTALAAVLYGLANANVGTVVRQRQMLLWAIFLFGGIGLSERFDFAISSDWRLADQSSSVADD